MLGTKLKFFSVFILFFLVLTSCSKPDIETIEKIGINSGGIALDIQIKNPYPLCITLSNIKMDVRVDEFDFKNITYTPRIILKPNSKLTYSITVEKNFFDDLPSYTGAFMALMTQDSTKITIDGTVRLKALIFHKRVPFHKELYFKFKK